ncbi:hypothetical protein V5H47_25515, partial [Salmonella enterica]|uniref:hypothetical protein n=1 Tax=Salmonella enterica TaxID=28901 RepID=UPI002FCD945D
TGGRPARHGFARYRAPTLEQCPRRPAAWMKPGWTGRGTGGRPARHGFARYRAPTLEQCPRRPAAWMKPG